MKKIISYIGIYIFLHSMYLIQGCCGKRTCQSVSTIEAFYTNNINDTLLIGDSVSYNDVLITVAPKTYQTNCRNSNSWISSAYAFSCWPEIYPMTELEKINIIATEDYTSAYPAGASLNEVFNFSEIQIGSRRESILTQHTQIRFKTPPDNNKIINLTIQFYYEHFDHPFEATLPTIYLKK